MGSVRCGAEYGRMSATDRRATHDYSRGFSPGSAVAGLRPLLLATALLGGGLLVAADLSTLYSVAVVTVTKASVSGHAQHSYALVLVGLAALALAAPAGRGGRGAMAALAVLGLAALLVVLLCGDFHDVHSAGRVGLLYDGATASPGRGFYFETLGALLLVAAGVGLLLLPRELASAAGPAAGQRPTRARAEPSPVQPGPTPRPRPARPATPPRRRPPAPDPPTPPPAPAGERDPDDWFA
jgi:hypothetical protein